MNQTGLDKIVVFFLFLNLYSTKLAKGSWDIRI